MLANPKKLRCLSFAQIPVFSFGFGIWGATHSGNNAANNSLDEFLLRKPGKCRTLLTENPSQGIRHCIPCSLDASLKPREFCLNLSQFFAHVCQTS